MELIHNELSSLPPCSDSSVANLKVAEFVKAFIAASDKGFKAIRFSSDFSSIELSREYTLLDWLNSTDYRMYKDILLAARRYPFISDDDTAEQDEYLANRYFFEDLQNGMARTECVGLAAAHIYSTIALSFSNSPAWEKNILEISRLGEVAMSEETATVANIFSHACLDTIAINDHIERISDLELISTDASPSSKSIHFRDDHGTDILQRFAEKVVNSPYVLNVVNSIEWQPRCPRFIFRVFPDGIIYVVLHWTDRGLGMAIQTTGRNLRETKEIAELLQTDYDR